MFARIRVAPIGHPAGIKNNLTIAAVLFLLPVRWQFVVTIHRDHPHAANETWTILTTWVKDKGKWDCTFTIQTTKKIWVNEILLLPAIRYRDPVCIDIILTVLMGLLSISRTSKLVDIVKTRLCHLPSLKVSSQLSRIATGLFSVTSSTFTLPSSR